MGFGQAWIRFLWGNIESPRINYSHFPAHTGMKRLVNFPYPSPVGSFKKSRRGFQTIYANRFEKVLGFVGKNLPRDCQVGLKKHKMLD
jgi:hypothetical protein